MRILITGSRAWTDETLILRTLKAHIEGMPVPGPVTVVHGGARGADQIAGRWASMMAGVLVEEHPADWTTHGKRAGFIRNAEMVNLGADICLAFIVDDSRGASMTVDLAEKAGIPIKKFAQI